MIWFNSEEKRKKMEFMQTFRPTSKIQLKQVCIWYYKGDLKKAQEMYEFYSNGLDLPDNDPVPPTWIDQAKSFMGWAKENQNELAQAYTFICSIIENKGKLPPVGIEPAGEPLPPINE